MIVDRILAIAELVQRLCVFAENEDIHNYTYEVSIGRNVEYLFTGVRLKFFDNRTRKIIEIHKHIPDIEICNANYIHDYLGEKTKEYTNDWEYYKRTGELPERD